MELGGDREHSGFVTAGKYIQQNSLRSVSLLLTRRADERTKIKYAGLISVNGC